MEGYKLRRSYDIPLRTLPVSQVMSIPASLHDALQDYGFRHPEEAATCAHFFEFLRSTPMVFLREHVVGHFTGSAWLVSADGERVLLTHHRKLQRWLQLGGHADGDSDLAAVALREASEESGLQGLTVDPVIFDVDRHWIPQRKHEAGHWHYDVRYVVYAGEEEDFVVSEESLELAWMSIRDLLETESTDESLRRMAHKWLVRSL